MEPKKKNFLGNLRLKTKLPHLKKPRKVLAKQSRGLAHRRSISVPDLSVPNETPIVNNPLASNANDAIFFDVSPGVSDSDSMSSASIAEGFLTDKLSEITVRTPPSDYQSRVSNRLSAPVESLTQLDEINSLTNRTSPFQEGVYTPADKKTKAHMSKFSFDPVPSPRHERMFYLGEDVPTNAPASSLTRAPSDTVAVILARSHLQPDQSNPCERRKALSEKGTPPPTRAFTDRMFLKLDVPLESTDGTSLDSTSGTPSEEQFSVPWTDSEELDRELFSSSQTKVPSNEEGTEEGQILEGLEELEMSSEPCDFFDDVSQDPLEASSSAGMTPAVCQRYLLNINLKQGRNLVVRNKRAGSRDPYVKFKLEGKQFYKSKVVYKNVNPRWNESFSHPLRDREHEVDVRVYDKNRTTDEFMGSSSISLNNLDLYRTYEMELLLTDPKSKEEVGVIVVDICLMFRDATIKRSPKWPPRKNKQNQAALPQRQVEPQRNQLKNQMWTGVLGINLVEGKDLPTNVQGDVYVRFRLGEQKYKSKNLCIQANPQWREQFDFNQFEENQEPLQVELFLKRGRKNEESWGLLEVDLSRLSLNERQLYAHVLDPGKGRLVFLVTLRPCWGVSVSTIETAMLTKPEEREIVMDKFSLKNSYKCMREVGVLQALVLKANDLSATDINGKSNPLCVVELGNCKLQTHTICKTLNPEWNKAFTFPIKDIHDVVELTVWNENGDKAPDFLGKVAIPLLTVQNGQHICLFLKKENLERTSKGTITLVLEVIYNNVRAGIKTFQPKETKLAEESAKFNKKVLSRNIYRVRKISTAVLYTLQYIHSCFQWESRQRSLIAFLIFLVTVWHFELFMLPLFLLLLIGWNYFQLTMGKFTANQDLVNMTMGEDEEEDDKDAGKKGLMDKIHMVQEVVLVVQNVLEEIANIGERIKNIFTWSVPFMSYLTCLVLFVGAFLLYLIPLRYLVLIWGINKFTKKLRNPYAIDNNEVLDFLKRVPSDIQKQNWFSQSGSGRTFSPQPVPLLHP
ncbi:multiple C2 and transmembrane domain-containing protein 2 isoform X2 [Gouania willdenowi]|uniref:Multiple C2 and transmembrane domain-containing protein 2-like n=1 Tax=Gouania willdenowi TaxID=441366 RepID=A0A8C5DR70_GOUWI|nr:multiple C2 and transmembrane domain-containing protein 2-like isoform X2 [Gouania willdenowi]